MSIPEQSPESYAATESATATGLYDLTGGIVSTTVGDTIEFRLREGASAVLPLNLNPMETKREVSKHLGIQAAVLAEVRCSSQYALLLLDRGPESQGQATPLIKKGPEISDRFLLIDTHAMFRLNFANAGLRQLRNLDGITQLCVGETVSFGRNQAQDTLMKRHFSGKDVKVPQVVSVKHATIAVPDEVSVRITDTYSTNGTTAVIRNSPRNRKLLER